MYALPNSSYLRRSLIANKHSNNQGQAAQSLSHNERIVNELRELGVTRYGLHKMESRYLPHIIFPGEHIRGIAYGWHDEGSVMLVATDHRVIYLDKKPMYMSEDEIPYDSIGGVSFGHAGLSAHITLYTPMKKYEVRTLNRTAARTFVNFIELRRMGARNERI